MKVLKIEVRQSIAEYVIVGTERCRVLVIMSHYMEVDLNMTRPKVFINDTTFNTNEEGFKVCSFLITLQSSIFDYYSSIWLPINLLTLVGQKLQHTFFWKPKQKKMYEMELEPGSF